MKQSTNNGEAHDVKIFVPAKNFALSLKFYCALGWKLNWQHEDTLAELELANSRFFLQNYYIKEWAENFMLYITVRDSSYWFKCVQNVLEEQADLRAIVKLQKPKTLPHAKVTFVHDPCGVLLHFAEEL